MWGPSESEWNFIVGTILAVTFTIGFLVGAAIVWVF